MALKENKDSLVNGEVMEHMLSNHDDIYKKYSTDHFEYIVNKVTGEVSKYGIVNGEHIKVDTISQESIDWFVSEAKARGEAYQMDKKIRENMAKNLEQKGEGNLQLSVMQSFNGVPTYYMPEVLENFILDMYFNGMTYDQVRAERTTNDRFWQIINSNYSAFISNGTGKVYLAPTNKSIE